MIASTSCNVAKKLNAPLDFDQKDLTFISMDMSTFLHLRPAKIKTYHTKTYDRISPLQTSNAQGKTLLITAGGMCTSVSSCAYFGHRFDRAITPNGGVKTNARLATGTGYAICQSFAKAGISRIIIIQRRQTVLDTAKRNLIKDFPDLTVETHAASQSDFPRMSSIIQSAGDIDILVACATSVQPNGLTKDISTDDFAAAFTVNVVGLHHLVKEFLALPSTMASGARKTVVHISSSGSQMQTALGLSSYFASKAAATQVITHFANDEPDSNVKFYSLHPGVIYSPMAQAAIPKDAMLWEDGKSSHWFQLATTVSCS